MKRETLDKILHFLVHGLIRIHAEGVENVPPVGTACLLATNHMSRLDTPILLVATPRPDIIALVADKYKTNPLFAFVVHTTGSIWLDRSKADFTAFRAALDYIRRGGILGIAPEGTRSSTSQLQQGKAGTVLLAEKARVPIVPVGISGSEVTMHKLTHLSKPEVTVRYGKPFMLPPIDRNDRENSLQQATDEIMCRIAALLPSKYWGFYKDHPRLLELLHPETEIM